MSSPTSASQHSQRSSQDTFFLLPDVYSESNNHKPRSEGAAAIESIGHSDSPAALRVPSRKGSKDESHRRVAEAHSSVEDVSAADEPLTSNTLDELEAELSKPTEAIGQSPKADSLLDDVENEFATKLAKAMVRRSEYYPASSDESDAFAGHRRKKSLKAKKDPEQAAAIKLRIEALENMMTELMESSGTSPSIHDKDEGNPAAAAPQSPDIMVLPTAAYAKAIKIPSSIATAAEVRVPSLAKQENKAPSTPPRLATQPDSAEPVPTQNASNIIPDFNPVAWLQRHDSPQEEKPDLRPSPVSSIEPVPVKHALLNLTSGPAHSTPALPKHSPPRSPPQTIPMVKKPSASKMELPVWASPGYNGPLPELIKIASPYLSKVLKRLMGGNEDWFSDQGVVLCRPYRPLLRHEATFRHLLAHLKDHPSPNALGDQVFEAVFEDSPDSPATLKALLDLQDAPVDDQALFYTQLLVNFIEYCLSPHIACVTSEDFQDISFSDLWYLFKPGGLVVSANEDQAYRVIEVVYRANAPGSMASFGVKCVHMDYDGQNIGPVISLFRVGKYFGKRNVTTLPVYPLRCNDDPSGLQRILVDRGRKSMKAIISRHMYCMGATLNDHQAVNGQVMIDFEGAFAHNSHWRPEILSIGESLFDKQVEKGSTEDNGPGELSSDRELASEYLMKHELTYPYLRSRKMVGGESSVSDDELMLLTHRIYGFILRTRKWASFSIEDMREVSNMADAESFKRLVLPQGHKAMLESLVRSHFRQREGKMHRRKQSNTIRGEGPGLNVLLHGGPGTGKTWTAECIAGAFEKPLFSITCGELGNTSTEIIKEVEVVFSLAQKWDCVLLLDDADMLFSERTKNDFSRDSLVSGFLRALDHYSGILFLTTSRVSVFDESFRSRIQFSLYCPTLDDKSSLEVWEVGIWQTHRRQRNIRIKDEEILEFAQELWDMGDYHFRWNGRQIRNAFQAALALAEADVHNENMPARRDSKGQSAVTLRRRHFEKVAKASMAFEQRLPISLGPPPTDQPPAQDLKRSNTGRTRERASTMPGLTRRPSQSLMSAGPLPPLPALPEGGPTRRPSAASKPNRQTHRARSSVGTSLRQEIWPARDSCESLVPVPELPKRESSADMWEVDRDRHDFTMRTPYEQLRL